MSMNTKTCRCCKYNSKVSVCSCHCRVHQLDTLEVMPYTYIIYSCTLTVGGEDCVCDGEDCVCDGEECVCDGEDCVCDCV